MYPGEGNLIRQKEIEEYIQSAEKDLELNRVQHTLHALEKALELDPDNLEVHYLMAIALIRNTEFIQAASHLDRVIESEFSYLHKQQAFMMLGYVYVQRELYEKAAELFETAWSYNFNNVAATAALGHIYFKLNRPDRAEEALRRALDIDPRNRNARNSLAYVLCESGGDLEEAQHLALSVVKTDPDNALYNDTLGWIYYKKGKEGPARETLQRALELAPENEEIKEHLRVLLNMD